MTKIPTLFNNSVRFPTICDFFTSWIVLDNMEIKYEYQTGKRDGYFGV
jgi:hypothetical protein